MKSLRIVMDVDNVLRTTLAGILALGVYPQKFFPSSLMKFLG